MPVEPPIPDEADAEAIEAHQSNTRPTEATGALAAAAQRVIERLALSPLPAGLHIVATPIGNLADVSLRALSVLARADVIYCEDTRHSIRLLQHYALHRPLAPYHEHNAEHERPRIVERLGRGQVVALISDAGTPLISDPGYKLVKAAREAGHGVWCLPGPSAPIAALSISGLPTDRFTFEGFLPAKSAARRNRLEVLESVPGTLVFFEAPQRLAESLGDMAAVLGHRTAAVAREMTKLHEEVRSGTLAQLADWARNAPVKGEIVVLVGPADKVAVDDALIVANLRDALSSLSIRDAAKHVSEVLGVPRSRVYQLALAVKG
jgi:16S rRNA (cytidine1402-2'-O)-methyltransferase